MGVREELFLLGDDRLYLRARAAFNVGLLLLLLWGLGNHSGLDIGALTLVIITTLGTAYVMFWSRRGRLSAAAMHVLVPDLIVLGVLTDVFRGRGDAFYPAVILLAVTYSLAVKRRDAWIAAAGVTIAYLTGHIVHFAIQSKGVFVLSRDIEVLLRAVTIPVVSLLVAGTVEHKRQRESETVAAVAEAAHLNAEMRHRISELQAVAEITEAVHSSLDFEKAGPVVLEILAEAINIDTCCLFVIDKDKSDTLFSASFGIEQSIPGISPKRVEDAEEHFTCTSIFDHSDAMVLFCSTAQQIESLSEQNRLVLGAVASELVVAVENSRLYRLTKTLAVTDELTGLSNYRFLQQRLDEEIERSRRYDKRLSLLMIDVDDFKGFNDSNGHLAGDQALAELGSVVRSTVREVDVVARYGGEEFSVMLPETDASGAFVTAEKIREAVSEYPFADGNGKRHGHMTVSIGVATMPTHATDKESLLREADDAVYNAKNGGKNRVRAAWGPTLSVEEDVPAEEVAVADEWTGE